MLYEVITEHDQHLEPAAAGFGVFLGELRDRGQPLLAARLAPTAAAALALAGLQALVHLRLEQLERLLCVLDVRLLGGRFLRRRLRLLGGLGERLELGLFLLERLRLGALLLLV